MASRAIRDSILLQFERRISRIRKDSGPLLSSLASFAVWSVEVPFTIGHVRELRDKRSISVKESSHDFFVKKIDSRDVRLALRSPSEKFRRAEDQERANGLVITTCKRASQVQIVKFQDSCIGSKIIIHAFHARVNTVARPRAVIFIAPRPDVNVKRGD